MDSTVAAVVIVSAFGRGHWMAVELQSAGVPVTLLDISSQMGAWAPEDWEGPFGYFKTDRVLPRHLDRLNQDEVPLLVPQGLIFWLSDGPLEMQGPVNKYRLEKLGFDIQQLGSPNLWGKLEFSKRWLYEALCAIDCPVHMPNPYYSRVATSIPVLQNFYIRQATRKGLSQSLDWVRAKGVKVIEKVQLVDVALADKSKVKGLEIKKDRSEFMNVDQVVWCLNGEETGMISSKVQSSLFPKGALESEWCWLRYRIKIKESSRRDQLPLHFVILGDPYLSWSHENFLIVQRTASLEFFDVWMKIPTEQRFNKQYLSERGEGLVAILKMRLVEDEITLQDFPQEYMYTYTQMGPPRFPVYNLASKDDRPGKKFENLKFDSSQQWKRLGWSGQFENQWDLVGEIKSWWQKKEELRIRQEQRKAKREKTL